MARRVGTVVALVLAVALGAILLWPDGWAVNRLVVRIYVFFLDLGMPLAVTPDHYALALNVLAFVAVGWVGVAVLRRPPWLVAAVLATASVLVETAQLWPGLHREPSLVDVACNAGGAVVGAYAASVVVRRRGRRGGVERVEHPRGDEVVDEGADGRRDGRG